MTNRERILKMTVEELLKFVALDVRGKKLHRILSKVMSCANCPVYTACYSETGDKCCSDYIGKWLDKEVQTMADEQKEHEIIDDAKYHLKTFIDNVSEAIDRANRCIAQQEGTLVSLKTELSRLEFLKGLLDRGAEQ